MNKNYIDINLKIDFFIILFNDINAIVKITFKIFNGNKILLTNKLWNI